MAHMISPHLPLTVNTHLHHHHHPSLYSLNNFFPSSSPITHTSIHSRPTTPFFFFNNPLISLTQNNTRTCRSRVSFLQLFQTKSEDLENLKQELLQIIAPLDRGADATPEQQDRVDQGNHHQSVFKWVGLVDKRTRTRQIARKLEAVNKIKEPLKSDLLNGKWELLYTTSQSILQTKVACLTSLFNFEPLENTSGELRPKLLRANGKIYQAINVDTLRAQNMETWPFFNQATANLVPLNTKRVAVKFDAFKVFSLIPIKARGSGRGQLEITYLDEELRISRGNEGNLFILRMVDPSYRVPL
ncbi:hypothetical protein M8C21_004781 [Ambrosia artemisiifolia]|uniref:Plastid lipid-associated protein/fibrillin conserved domain-containing protein n=1 Tax=Ambrosia artemisiifolia TaxID=4212 RepID=A0AAD5BNS1_AMBAR|nr:hypothetical protein M8C21_004781 [Ambrosia artemisiifolia]